MIAPLITPKPFYMIRHGESEANRDGYFSGNIDSQLTEIGRAQAATARDLIKDVGIKPDIIVHSHLSRARDTAGIINEVLNLEMIETELIGEHKFGDWERQLWEELSPQFRAGENPPNGETHIDFENRVQKGLNFALAQEESVLIVCHGGIFRGFQRIYDQNHIEGVQNARLYTFTPKDDTDFPWEIELVG